MYRPLLISVAERGHWRFEHRDKVTTSRMQQCFNVLIDIYHEFLLLFYCCVLLEIKLTTTTTTTWNPKSDWMPRGAPIEVYSKSHTVSTFRATHIKMHLILDNVVVFDNRVARKTVTYHACFIMNRWIFSEHVSINSVKDSGLHRVRWHNDLNKKRIPIQSTYYVPQI